MQEHYFETIIIPSDCAEVFADFIIEITGEGIEEKDIQSDISKILQHPVYFNISSLCLPQKAYIVYSVSNPQDKLIALIENLCLELSERLEHVIGFAYQTKICKNEDWIENYKNSIIPIVQGKFYIRPSWYQPLKDKIDIVIDPALAFGSGHHASTSMCLEFLCQTSLKGKDILDVGCGSGILSIGAKKLGGNVHLCDTDEFAIIESKKNFALNGLNIDKIWQGSVDKTNHLYDVVVANILADIIKILSQDFMNVLKPCSILILSGILKEYEQSVLDKFSDFKILGILNKEGWVGLKLTQK
ncbi:50S ribosomal protein L11 methyltransferase [Helicobacter sp. 11S03491-1]|uniref:50S ribosomal protein L11 methyltransferase n=1 Tax=Helicobacter sp. 11S03491-1 TaxID=1476196 RepID=UPI000BA77474|nr:50S ribosomal protein L11 methyltransferase [Helicobacter sp. 11S03491-1]PAF43307.1 ribosomal protein L11 methyltransferase [Helicobacter sp. 11S03491-1]